MRMSSVLPLAALRPSGINHAPRFGIAFDTNLLDVKGDFKAGPNSNRIDAIIAFFNRASETEAKTPLVKADNQTPLMRLVSSKTLAPRTIARLLQTINSDNINFATPYTGNGPNKGKPVVDFVEVKNDPRLLKALLGCFTNKKRPTSLELDMLFGDNATVRRRGRAVTNTWAEGVDYLREVCRSNGPKLKWELNPAFAQIWPNLNDVQANRFISLFSHVYGVRYDPRILLQS